MGWPWPGSSGSDGVVPGRSGFSGFGSGCPGFGGTLMSGSRGRSGLLWLVDCCMEASCRDAWAVSVEAVIPALLGAMGKAYAYGFDCSVVVDGATDAPGPCWPIL